MNDKQISAIRYAYLDLVGADEAINRGNVYAHDWDALRASIADMIIAFPEELHDLISDELHDLIPDEYDEFGVNTRNTFNTPPES